jgi:hypothetical protein
MRLPRQLHHGFLAITAFCGFGVYAVFLAYSMPGQIKEKDYVFEEIFDFGGGFGGNVNVCPDGGQ